MRDNEPAAVSSLPRAARPTLVARVVAAFAAARTGARALTQLGAYDTTTEEGRSLERYRRATLSSLTSLAGHALGAVTGLVFVRVTLSYLGKERYGLWMAASSLLTWAALADFGLGRGLQNHLGEAYAKGDRVAGARYVSTGFASLSGIALALGVLFVPLYFVVPWASLLNVRDPALARETRTVVGAVVTCFLLAFPLNLVATVYTSQQRGYVANLFNIAGSLLSLCALFSATWLRLDLPWLILALGGAGLLMSALNWGYVLRELPWLWPRLPSVSGKTLRLLAGTSLALLLFQLSNLLLNEAQILIVARRLGLERVADYTVFCRVHVLPIIVISTLDAPMMPAFREAHVRGDADWLRRAFFRIVKIKMGIAVGGTAFYFLFGNFVAALFSSRTISFGPDVWAAGALLLVVGAWNGAFCDLMIATNRLWYLAAMVALSALVTSCLSFWLAGKLAIFGVVLASPLGSILLSGWILPWACRDLLRKREPEFDVSSGHA